MDWYWSISNIWGPPLNTALLKKGYLSDAQGSSISLPACGRFFWMAGQDTSRDLCAGAGPRPGDQDRGRKGVAGVSAESAVPAWCPLTAGHVHGAREHSELPAGDFVCRHVPRHTGRAHFTEGPQQPWGQDPRPSGSCGPGQPPGAPDGRCRFLLFQV